MHNRFGVAAFVVAALAACGSASNNGGNGSLDFGDGAPQGDAAGGGCSALCARQAAAGCSAYDMGTCMSQCAMLTANPMCAAQGAAALQCAVGATYTCGSTGRPTTMMCLAEVITALNCGQDGATVGDASAD